LPSSKLREMICKIAINGLDMIGPIDYRRRSLDSERSAEDVMQLARE
jgi:hypothetical protein